MGRNPPTKEKFEVPSNYYIQLHGGPTMSYGYFKHSQDGDCIVTAYKSLDNHGGEPQHVVKVGGFVISNVEDKKVGEFLEEIREGIEKLISEPTKKNCN